MDALDNEIGLATAVGSGTRAKLSGAGIGVTALGDHHLAVAAKDPSGRVNQVQAGVPATADASKRRSTRRGTGNQRSVPVGVERVAKRDLSGEAA